MKCPYCDSEFTSDELMENLEIKEGRLGYKVHYINLFICPRCETLLQITTKV